MYMSRYKYTACGNYVKDDVMENFTTSIAEAKAKAKQPKSECTKENESRCGLNRQCLNNKCISTTPCTKHSQCSHYSSCLSEGYCR